MKGNFVDDVWYPDVEYVETVTTSLVPVLFPNYDVLEPDFQYLGGEQGRGLLVSSLARPMPYFGEDRFPSLSDKAATLIWSITLNHPFNDGNKRTALTTGICFLAKNRSILIAHQDEAVELCLRVAANTPGYTESFLSRWIRDRSVRMDQISGFLRGESISATETTDSVLQRLESLPEDYHLAWLRFYRILSEWW